MAVGPRAGCCLVCGQGRLVPHFVLDNHRYYKCRHCGLIQVRPLPLIGTGDDYSALDLGKYRLFTRLFLVPQYGRALRMIRRFKPGGSLLDIGCGTGEFLGLAREAGFDATGVEPSSTACLIAAVDNKVIAGEWRDVPIEEGAYDVITLWSVLEHIPDPFPFLDKVRGALKSNGILALRVPTSQGLLPLAALWFYRLSGRRIKAPLRAVYQTEWHYAHFYYYSRWGIGLLLRKCRFKIAAVRGENSFDIKSLKYRMDYLPKAFIRRAAVQSALFLIKTASNLLGRRDEMVIIAGKQEAEFL